MLSHAQAPMYPPAGAPLFPAVGTDPMSEPQLRASLSLLETTRQAFLGYRTNAPAVMTSAKVDGRGQTFAQDWQQYCLNSTEQADLAHRFTDAYAALDAHDLTQGALDQRALYHRLHVAGIQCKNILDYWNDMVIYPRDWAPYLAMLRANGVERHYAVNIQSLERTLKLQVSHGLFIDAIGGSWTQLERVRQRGQQLDLEVLRDKAETPDFQGMYPTTTTGACVPAAPNTSGKAKPGLAPGPQPLLKFPDRAEHDREWGTVTVGLTIAATGCARSGFVLGSSGFERLDRAGLSYAMSLHFLPAEENGVAIERFTMIPINYRLPGFN